MVMEAEEVERLSGMKWCDDLSLAGISLGAFNLIFDLLRTEVIMYCSLLHLFLAFADLPVYCLLVFYSVATNCALLNPIKTVHLYDISSCLQIRNNMN